MTTDSASARNTDMLAYKQATIKLAFEWSSYLSPAETTLVLWLLANTIGRNRDKGSYSVSQMVNGVRFRADTPPRSGLVKAPDGTPMWCLGTGLSEATVHRTIASLEAKKLIWVFRETNKASNFMVNVNWSPTHAQPEDTNVVEFPTRKPVKRPSLATLLKTETDNDVSETDDLGSQNDTPRGLNLTPPGSQNDTHQRTHLTKDSPQTRVSVSPPAHAAAPITASEIIAQKTVTPPAAPKTPASGRITVIMLEQDWRRLHRDAFPTVQPVAWTAKEQNMLRGVMKKFDPAQFREFLQWLVLNWSHAITTYCGWMKDKPAVPVVGFVAKHHRALFQAWADRKQHEYRGTLPRAEQQIAQFMAKGLTREAAVLEVAKLGALAEDREQRERDLAVAAATMRSARAMEQAAEAKMRRDAAELGRMARQQRQQTAKPVVTDSFDLKNGAELEQLPPIDLEKL